MKKSILIATITFLILFCIFLTPTFGKYVIEENIVAGTLNIDRTPPNVEETYSTREKTSQPVEVTLQADEQVQDPGNGWVLQEDGCTLKKKFEQNTQEEVEIKDKAGNSKKVTIEVNNIDTIAPVVEILSIYNSNESYPNYANQETQISINLLVKDDQKIQKSLEKNDIHVLINNKEIDSVTKEFEVIRKETKEQEVKLKLFGIKEEGNLSISIQNGVIQDETGNTNVSVTKDTNIQIDNTKPQGIYSQEKIEAGKIEAKIIANEEIRKLDGWTLENKTILKKIFTNNLSYITTIQDLAGNSSQVEINIIEATNIILSYASHNSVVSWSYGYGNYDIAGLEAIRKNATYKTESLAFNISGDVEKDYLQARAYVYTHWGEEGKGRCEITGQIYSNGWNPQGSDWKYETQEDRILLNGKYYFQLGGGGVNGIGKGDMYNENPIPEEIAKQYRYGISALQIKLKSYNENSICYQVYVDSVGWLSPAKNGELTCYDTTKPISALRIALVPNSEVDALINTRNQDERKIYSIKKLVTIN